MGCTYLLPLDPDSRNLKTTTAKEKFMMMVVHLWVQRTVLTHPTQKCCTQSNNSWQKLFFIYTVYSCFLSLTSGRIWLHILKVTNIHTIDVFASLKFNYLSAPCLVGFVHVSSQSKYCRIIAVRANKWELGFVQMQITQPWVNWNQTNWDCKF